MTLALLLCVFFGSGFYVGAYFWEGRQQEQQFDELSQLVQQAQAAAESTRPRETKPAGETVPAETTQPEMLPGYAELYAQNPDTVGWIRIEGTRIDYPVMQTPYAQDYYLKRNFAKDASARGCIYVREECDVFAPSDNVTIYGHTMADGTMFAALHNYLDSAFWKNHDTIQFDTLYEYHEYKIFAVFKTTATYGEGFSYHQLENAQTETEFNEFVAKCKELAFYETDITPKYGDKLICLSTCEYSQDNGRLVVAAVRTN